MAVLVLCSFPAIGLSADPHSAATASRTACRSGPRRAGPRRAGLGDRDRLYRHQHGAKLTPSPAAPKLRIRTRMFSTGWTAASCRRRPARFIMKAAAPICTSASGIAPARSAPPHLPAVLRTTNNHDGNGHDGACQHHSRNRSHLFQQKQRKHRVPGAKRRRRRRSCSFTIGRRHKP